jgi:hypothetical protein
MRGLLPVRLVQTVNVPFGVAMGIRFTPPDSTSSRPVLSKYEPTGEAVATSPAPIIASAPVEPGRAHPCASKPISIVIQSVFIDSPPPRRASDSSTTPGLGLACSPFTDESA